MAQLQPALDQLFHNHNHLPMLPQLNQPLLNNTLTFPETNLYNPMSNLQFQNDSNLPRKRNRKQRNCLDGSRQPHNA